ncbi:MAG: tRNA pseudouridine(54/55) synthase Pus10 [Candidatus Aenigmarchaeota archaeon]|nr:tRNA pseudouridine(54/55) synthase Pus10 [Candidatus Aenigmarchaeota archaeon]
MRSLMQFLQEILSEHYLCDHCLGRQTASLLSGYSNKQRGFVIRTFIAFLVDSGEELKIKKTNFYGINFRFVKLKPEKEECYLCNGLFEKLEEKAKKIIDKIKDYEFSTFLVGTNPPNELMNREVEFWEKYGIEWAESINTEINREIGKIISKITGKDLDRKTPDITILYDFNKKRITFLVRSIFIFGRYQKFSRKMPQCNWRTRIYKKSVQSVIEKPLLKQTNGEKTSFHGEGREDVDVRCLGWRPFVIEVINPKKRKVDLKKLLKEINKNKYVKVKDLKIVDRSVVKQLKAAKPDKTYRAIITFSKPLKDLSKLKSLEGTIINQQTPIRVLQRRADMLRKRKVKKIRYKLLSNKKLQLIVRAQSGLYIKELIHGDNGRTKPNIQELLNNKVKNIELDVIKIHE